MSSSRLARATLWLSIAVAVASAPHGRTAAQASALELVATVDGQADLVTVEGTYAYVVAEAQLRIIDVSDPSRPAERGTLTVPERIYGLHVVGRHAYLAGGLEGLHIVDISNPAAPELLATHQTAGQALGVTTAGTTALIVNLMTGLEVVDISDRSAPALLFTQDTPGYQWGIGGIGSQVLVVDQPSGIYLFDVSDPETPVELGVHSTEQPAQSVAVGAGHRAYVVYGRTGLVEIVDIEDASSPRLVGSYQSAGRPQRVAVQGFDMVVPAGEAGIELVDVSNPATPTSVASYDTPGTARSAALSNNLVIVADGDALLILRRR